MFQYQSCAEKQKYDNYYVLKIVSFLFHREQLLINAIVGLPLCAGDAFLLFQDLVQLVNADQPYWLIGMTEMTRTFGLELLESVLNQFSSVFYKVK